MTCGEPCPSHPAHLCTRDPYHGGQHRCNHGNTWSTGPPTELRGVRLGDLYRDKNGDLWEVYALCDEPQASVRRITGNPPVSLVPPPREHHVIGCPNWTGKWAAGPLREVKP